MQSGLMHALYCFPSQVNVHTDLTDLRDMDQRKLHVPEP